MSLLVVGLSHRTAPVPVLEKVAVSGEDVGKVLDELHAAEAVGEVMVLSTCNRVEIYADVPRFHPGEIELRTVLTRHSGLPMGELADHLYVHFAEAAAQHLFAVASGLDSMVVGESQILGQLRQAYAVGTELGTVGTVLHDLTQTALRVGKRVHSETGIDRAGASIVSVALDRAQELIGRPEGLDGLRAVVVGAGSMGALAGATLRRRGVADIVVVNRSPERGARLATSLGGRAATMDDLALEIGSADLLVSCTGATGLVVERHLIAADGPRQRPLVALDLALPRDIDPGVAEIPGVSYVDLDALRAGGAMVSDAEVGAATAIVAGELQAHLEAQQRLAVAPTVTALRARANQVIEAELLRLDGRIPELTAHQRDEVAAAVRRAVEKVLHAPTVRVKELATMPGGDQYAAALRELFDLDPAAIDAVAAVKPAAGARGGAQ